MRPDIPSLMSLLAFEAAARHLSFTAAGRELDLTQTAISHQIRNLEERLDTELFVRHRNVLQLTAAGRSYLESVREAISLLHNATTRTRREKTVEILTVNCLPTYATRCLIHALPEFEQEHPGITLQVLTNQTFDQFKRRSYDVAIRYGTGNWSGLRADLLAEEEIFPICAPALLARSEAASAQERLSAMNQIRTYFSSTYQDDWPVWLEAAGLAMVEFPREIIFNLQLTSLQAALDGVGVAMGRTPLVDRDMETGVLCQPCDFRLKTGSGYYLVSPEDKAGLDKVNAFREWACQRLRTPAVAQAHAA